MKKVAIKVPAKSAKSKPVVKPKSVNSYDQTMVEWLKSSVVHFAPQNLSKVSRSELANVKRKIGHWRAEVDYYLNNK